MKNKTRYLGIIELEESSEVIVRRSSLKELFKALLYFESREDFWCIRCILKEDWDERRTQVDQWTEVDVPRNITEALSNA